MSIEKKARIEYLDIAKAIGILCIIAGHMGVLEVDRVVFTFHVPLFFLICGYFLNSAEEMIPFIKKNIRSLLVPYYFTGLCLILIKVPIDIIKGIPNQIPKDLFHTLILVLYASGTDANKTIGGISQIGAIWFLYALFWAKIIVKISFVLKKSVGQQGFLIIVALLSYFSSLYIWLPFNIQAGGVASLFVYLGTLFRNWDILEKLDWKILLIGLITLLLEVNFNICLYSVSNTYDYGIVSMIGAVLISGFIVKISRYLEKVPFIKRIMVFYGQNTIIVLCYHLLELNNAPWHRMLNVMQILDIAPEMQYFCLFIAKIIFITLCTYITLHIKCLRKIFGRG